MKISIYLIIYLIHYSTSLPTTSQSTLILKNINTSSNSIINGTTFIANNDSTNKNDIIANFPNNTSTENIQFYKSTQFNKKVTVNSNINLTGNLSVSDQFFLLNTNSFVSKGHSDFMVILIYMDLHIFQVLLILKKQQYRQIILMFVLIFILKILFKLKINIFQIFYKFL